MGKDEKPQKNKNQKKNLLIKIQFHFPSINIISKLK